MEHNCRLGLPVFGYRELPPSRELELMMYSSCGSVQKPLVGYDSNARHSIGWGENAQASVDVMGTLESDTPIGGTAKIWPSRMNNRQNRKAIKYTER